MSNEFAPRHLPIGTFAQQHGSLQGRVPLAQFSRLHADCLPQEVPAFVEFSCHGQMRPDAAGRDEPWIHLTAQTRLTLVCQRCLQPVDVEVSFARDFRFVPTEALAEVEDEESEEDVLAISPSFDLLELVEDELLLETPVAPKHPVCPVPLKLAVADPDFSAPEAPQPHPFAALAALKNKDPG